jgi:hypothetical protein
MEYGNRRLKCDLGLYGINAASVPNGCDTHGVVSVFRDSETLNVVDENSPEFKLVRKLASMGFAGLRLDLGAELNTSYVRKLIEHFNAKRSLIRKVAPRWIVEFYGSYQNLSGAARQGGDNVCYYDNTLRKNMLSMWANIAKRNWSEVKASRLFVGSIVGSDAKLAYNWVDNHNIGSYVETGKTSHNFPGNSPRESIDSLLWAYTILFTLPSTISVWAFHDSGLVRIAPLSDDFLPQGIRSITDPRMGRALTKLSELRASDKFLMDRTKLHTYDVVFSAKNTARITMYYFGTETGVGSILVYIGKIGDDFIKERIRSYGVTPLGIYRDYDSWKSEGWAPVVVAVRTPYEDGRTRISDMSVSERLRKGLPLLEAYCQFKYNGDIKGNGIIAALTLQTNTKRIEAIYSGAWFPPCQEQSFSTSAGFAPKFGFNVKPFWAYGGGIDSYALEQYVRDLNRRGKIFAIVDTTIRKYHVGEIATPVMKRVNSGKCSRESLRTANVQFAARLGALLVVIKLLRSSTRPNDGDT